MCVKETLFCYMRYRAGLLTENINNKNALGDSCEIALFPCKLWQKQKCE